MEIKLINLIHEQTLLNYYFHPYFLIYFIYICYFFDLNIDNN